VKQTRISSNYFTALSRLRFSKFGETEHKKILIGMVLLYQVENPPIFLAGQKNKEKRIIIKKVKK
jgi:hypothetical protein